MSKRVHRELGTSHIITPPVSPTSAGMSSSSSSFRPSFDLPLDPLMDVSAIVSPLYDSSEAHEAFPRNKQTIITDLFEGSDSYEICVDAPGFCAKDITVEYDASKHALHVILDHSTRETLYTMEKGWTVRNTDRSVQHRSGWFTLPKAIDADKISTSLSFGLLTITCPKTTPGVPVGGEVTLSGPSPRKPVAWASTE